MFKRFLVIGLSMYVMFMLGTCYRTSTMHVESIEGELITLIDSAGEAWEIEEDNTLLREGETIYCLMDENNTEIIEDDIIIYYVSRETKLGRNTHAYILE